MGRRKWRIRKDTPEQIIEKQQQSIKRARDANDIIKEIKDSIIGVEPAKCCYNCCHGENRYGGWGCNYEETWCRLLYAHIAIVSGHTKAFKEQVINRYYVCKLYEPRR